MSIIKLDNSTIEKIAAGEVIESPESIVKELVENSIDANSTKITVEIKNGGKSYIRVTDNGMGIAKNDLSMAFNKHTTSKINQFSDIYSILSLGFRGEALSSIKSVADITCISKQIDEEIGNKITFISEKESIGSIATNQGTSIIVTNLFKDIPVRRKFLKSDITEGNKILKLITSFALGYNNISFKFIKNDRIEFDTSSVDTLKDRATYLLDDALYDNLIEINSSNETYSISGYISKSSYYRGNRSLEYIFVNNRLVESQLISNCIEDKYLGKIPNGRFPAFFIFINTNPKNLDVNVHPNKKTIKFNYEDELITLIESAIEKNLQSNLIPDKIHVKEHKNDELIDFTNYQSILDSYNKVDNKVKDSESAYITNTDIKKHKFKTDQSPSVNSVGKNTQSTYITKDNISYLGSVFSRYSILKMKNKVFIMDHRRADERIKIEKLINDFNNGSISKQLLLEPVIINLRSFEVNRYLEKKELIDKLGFESDKIGDKSIIIRSHPSILDIRIDESLFFDLIDIDFNNHYEYMYKSLKKIALKSVFRKNDTINEKETLALFNELNQLENPYKTKDGQATIIEIEQKELEKYFDR